LCCRAVGAAPCGFPYPGRPQAIVRPFEPPRPWGRMNPQSGHVPGTPRGRSAELDLGPGGVRRVRRRAARAALPQGTNTCSARFKIMNALSNWPRNRLLLALSSRDLKRVMPELEHIRCQRAQVLLDADSSLDHVFFPDSGVVSVVAVYADGSVIEMATIGREGYTGMQAFFGARTSSVRLLVQIPGSATKMSRAAFTRAMESMPSFRNVMSAYIQAFLEQVLVSVACNGAHSLKQRLARWLLMMRDRGDEDALLITQNLLAEMLGVQRPTVTNAARELERAGLIKRGRRQVMILDRRGLLEESCECYQLVRTRIAFHLPKTYV
jgi:CRP-like cAMP-binding protein